MEGRKNIRVVLILALPGFVLLVGGYYLIIRMVTEIVPPNPSVFIFGALIMLFGLRQVALAYQTYRGRLGLHPPTTIDEAIGLLSPETKEAVSKGLKKIIDEEPGPPTNGEQGMRLTVSELDGGEHFHGTAYNDKGEYLFQASLVMWLSGVGRCIVKSLDSGKVYLVKGDWTMEEIRCERREVPL